MTGLSPTAHVQDVPTPPQIVSQMLFSLFYSKIQDDSRKHRGEKSVNSNSKQDRTKLSCKGSKHQGSFSGLLLGKADSFVKLEAQCLQESVNQTNRRIW